MVGSSRATRNRFQRNDFYANEKSMNTSPIRAFLPSHRIKQGYDCSSLRSEALRTLLLTRLFRNRSGKIDEGFRNALRVRKRRIQRVRRIRDNESKLEIYIFEIPKTISRIPWVNSKEFPSTSWLRPNERYKEEFYVDC